MGKLSVRVPHTLGKKEALFRSQDLLRKLQRRHSDIVSDVREEWSGDQLTFGFKAKGFNIEGIGTVGEDFVEISGDLPWTANLFRGKIESTVEQELRDLLREG